MPSKHAVGGSSPSGRTNIERCNMDTKQKIEVMQAFLDGRPIEVSHSVRGNDRRSGWSLLDRNEPKWNWAELDYRIAEDMELKAYNIFTDALKYTVRSISDTERKWMRSIIDAVKRGEIY